MCESNLLSHWLQITHPLVLLFVWDLNGTLLGNAAPDGSSALFHDDRWEWSISRMITGGERAKFSQEVLLLYRFSCYKFRVDCLELETLASAVKSWTLLSGRNVWVTWSSHCACTKLTRKIPSNLMRFCFSRKWPSKLPQASFLLRRWMVGISARIPSDPTEIFRGLFSPSRQIPGHCLKLWQAVSFHIH